MIKISGKWVNRISVWIQIVKLEPKIVKWVNLKIDEGFEEIVESGWVKLVLDANKANWNETVGNWDKFRNGKITQWTNLFSLTCKFRER